MPTTEYPCLPKIKKELALLQKLYTLYNAVMISINGYYDILWVDVDIEKINIELLEFQSRIRKLPKGLKEWQAFLDLQKKIVDFNESCPLLELMANKAMKPRHWDRISNVTGHKFDLESDAFALKNIMDAPLLEFKEDIEDICISAVKEKDIEAKLAVVVNDWSIQIFSFGSFKTRGELLLKGTETQEIVSLLEDSLMVLSSLHSNRYNAPFKKTIQQWVLKLSNTNDIIENWMIVQNLWVYLEAVFVGGDIARQLPQEAKRFSNIDKTWVRIMNKAHETPNVVECCVGDETLGQLLPHLLEQLEMCQKSLTGYLEGKRLIFPRFFFVSDPALLEILGQASDSHTIQAHLLGIFENVASVQFHDKEYDRMLSCISREGEVVTVGLLGIQMLWTKESEEALAQARYDKKAMQITNQRFLDILNILIDQTTRDLGKFERIKYETLITIHVHQRDIFDDLVRMHIKSMTDFEWLKQSRFYFKEDLDHCIVQITDVNFIYQNEFLGCTDRLVITPLTDRCYITLAQALGMSMGGAPAGPAGTGKTESVKDMGKALGKYVVVFNCSDQMDFRGLGRIFKGLAESGSWGCFDEFNRIELPVLSVAAQQIYIILTAKKERKKDFIFSDGDHNPGYAGRQELPENLKVQFRTVAMMVPDRQIIIRVKLASCGFVDNIVLSQKFFVLYKLCEEQLSKQVDEDEPLFLSLIADLFPAIQLESGSYALLQRAIENSVQSLQLINHPSWNLKVVQLYETQLVRHGMMALGPSGAGKSCCINVLMKSLSEMGMPHREVRMNPKAITAPQMFGRLDVATNDWTDDDHIWLILDGPVDAIWIENLNSVLDDNKTLTLANGDRIPMAANCKILFEVHNIDNASPATVSRNGEWEHWSKRVEEYVYPSDSIPEFASILVPNVDNVRTDFLIQTIAKQNKGVLLIGEQGTAKTVMIKSHLSSYDPEVHLFKALNFSSATTPYMFQRTVESYVEKRMGSTYGPPGGRKMTVFIDDINMPIINEWGDQVTNEITRQCMEMRGMYNLDKPGDFTHVVDIQFIAAMIHPGGGRNDIPERLKRHFSIFNCTLPANSSIDKIFANFMDDLKYLYKEAGALGHGITFIFTDNDIKDEAFLEYMNNVLSSGEVLIEVTQSASAAEKVKASVQKVKDKAQAIVDNIAVEKALAEEKLEAAKPALEEAEAALLLMSGSGFLNQLMQFPKDTINGETVELLEPYLRMEDYNMASAKKANLVKQQARLDGATVELNDAQAILDEKQRELDVVQALYDSAMTEKQLTSLNHKYFRTHLEDALSLGRALLLEDVGEELDPALDNVLEKNFIKSGRTYKVKVGDKEVEIMSGFYLYITTKMPNPSYTPEISARTSIIDFTVTMKGLEEQLLGRVIMTEKQELEAERTALIEDVSSNKRKMKELEDNLLYKLTSIKGSLVDDESLIVVLAVTKSTASEVQEKLVISADTEAKINEAREEFRPVAARGSILYFLITEMSMVNCMYQTSLKQFLGVFDIAMHKSPKSPLTGKRIYNIIEYLTYAVFLYTCRGLYETHKFLFTLLLTLKIDIQKQRVAYEEFLIFIKGGAALDLNAVQQKPCRWIVDMTWLNLVELSRLPHFSDILNQIGRNEKAWKQWFDKDAPEEEIIPDGYTASLDTFKKLMLIRSWCPDRTIAQARKYIATAVGQRFAEPVILNLKETLLESEPRTPLICFLSMGSDPTNQIEDLAKKMQIECRAVSMGQGQEVHARKLMAAFMAEGGWALLQNCHLGLNFMDELLEIVTDTEAVNDRFRIWITTEVHPQFPISLLQERRKFGPLGWNIPYEFNSSDWYASVQFIQNHLDDMDPKKGVSWNTVRYMIGEVQYGGRVTDDYDKKLLITYNKVWMADAMFHDSFHFYTGYKIPRCKRISEFLDYIEDLPAVDTPEVFGLHPNADITYQTNMAKEVLDTILSIQPKEGGGGSGGETRETIVYRQAEEMLEKLPPNYLSHEVRDRLKKMGHLQPLNIFLRQEIDRMQRVIQTVRSTLMDLKLAIDGTIIMNENLRDALDNMYDAKVPAVWKRVSWESSTLGFWFTEFLERNDQFSKWISEGRPNVFWMTGFLTAMRQEVTRAHKGWSLDTVILHNDVTKWLKDDINSSPSEGVYVYGLYLEGASWDRRNCRLTEPQPKVLSVMLPVVYIYAMQIQPKDVRLYSCPVYKKPQRTDLTYVTILLLKSIVSPDHWILRGVAALCDIK
ncbi:hypothetical protein NP493_45g04011 [Ridgeia piscesae]|uniref:Dynein heavy chain n=1 Tax=Ridgeia piscesae TaxID=27915 RepID=A0AAD9PC36_RIDPI|nr:hypothetical protein NP493_45g04011 [Ridgeia piscesae]